MGEIWGRCGGDVGARYLLPASPWLSARWREIEGEICGDRRGFISPIHPHAPPLHLPYISPTSPCISPTRLLLHARSLPYISLTSDLHLPISPGRSLAAEDTNLTRANSSDPFYKLLVKVTLILPLTLPLPLTLLQAARQGNPNPTPNPTPNPNPNPSTSYPSRSP